MLEKDYEFNMLGIYNYKKKGKLYRFINHIRDNEGILEGDIVEAGVYRGAQTIALALLLKELRSTKKIYAYDSFKGFPPVYHSYDDHSYFDILFEQGLIDEEHFMHVMKYRRYKEAFGGTNDYKKAATISCSGDFSDNNLQLLKKKIEMLSLDNIVIMKGDFNSTMHSRASPERVMAAILDCDLYWSYWTALNFLSTRLVNRSLVYLDEYYSLKFPGARIATNEFIDRHKGSLQLEMDIPVETEFERWYIRKLDYE